ncbi:MAG: lipopolysaccharide assembly protein LapB [Gammaproteobacteria bacterium]
MSQWLLLLLPVAAMSGWWVARRQLGREGHNGSDLSSNYFKGLNYLLNEQPDKAIEVFIRMLEVDSETVETHLALGNLFRRRGEVDRAIRIHQNLIARPTLNRQQRTQALLELGQDYMRAGLLDRAETLFQELIDMNDHTEPALRHLIDIYQQEKEWGKAIVAIQKLELLTGIFKAPIIAHYHCELADLALHNSDPELARHRASLALECDRNCVRASLLLAGIEMAEGDYKAALGNFKNIQYQDADYLPEIVAPLLKCYSRLGMTGEIIDYLQQMLQKHNSITLMLTLAELLRAQQGDQQAASFITEQLRKRPSVRGLDRLIELNLTLFEGDARDNLLILKDLIAKLLEGKPIYKCNNCGFAGKAMHWQCPGCKNWSSIKPIQGVEGE